MDWIIQAFILWFLDCRGYYSIPNFMQFQLQLFKHWIFKLTYKFNLNSLKGFSVWIFQTYLLNSFSNTIWVLIQFGWCNELIKINDCHGPMATYSIPNFMPFQLQLFKHQIFKLTYKFNLNSSESFQFGFFRLTSLTPWAIQSGFLFNSDGTMGWSKERMPLQLFLTTSSMFSFKWNIKKKKIIWHSRKMVLIACYALHHHFECIFNSLQTLNLLLH